VPAAAEKLELVAAQLAATGVTRGKPGHPATALYATADGLSAALIARAGRYVQGAVLAPVFFPDERLAEVVERFRDAFGEEPGAASALAWDAVRAARDALRGAPPAEPRAGIAARLSAGADEGLTGRLGFGPGGERLGPPLLFVVDGDRIRALR
jgi:ABC-type branched-subunit amino acid transport system substrate-binding protein